MDSEVVPSLGVLPCPVEGIDHPDPAGPDPFRASRGIALLLRQHGVVGTGVAERRHDELVGQAVALASQRPGVVESHVPTQSDEHTPGLRGDAGGQLVVVGRRQMSHLERGRCPEANRVDRTGKARGPAILVVLWGDVREPVTTSSPISRRSRRSRSTSCVRWWPSSNVLCCCSRGEGLGGHAPAGREGLLAGPPALPDHARRHRAQFPARCSSSGIAGSPSSTPN